MWVYDLGSEADNLWRLLIPRSQPVPGLSHKLNIHGLTDSDMQELQGLLSSTLTYPWLVRRENWGRESHPEAEQRLESKLRIFSEKDPFSFQRKHSIIWKLNADCLRVTLPCSSVERRIGFFQSLVVVLFIGECWTAERFYQEIAGFPNNPLVYNITEALSSSSPCVFFLPSWNCQTDIIN